MNHAIEQALVHDLTIDITTTGRKTGHRIEIGFHNLDGELYWTGLPRPCIQKKLGRTGEEKVYLSAPNAMKSRQFTF
jgi:hypothetical protein